jgi:hypothetical protein
VTTPSTCGNSSRAVRYYTHAAHIDTAPGDVASYRTYTQRVAAERGWQFEDLLGHLGLPSLLDGDWDDDRLVVPRHQVLQRVGPEVLTSGP